MIVSPSTKTPGIEWGSRTAGSWQTSSRAPSAEGALSQKVALAELSRLASQSSEFFLIDSGLVQTWDKADPIEPYKCLPDDLDYLRYLIRWLDKIQKTATPKSRDMIATLAHCGWHLKEGMFRDGSEIVCISDKAEKAEHNLGRMLFSYASMPQELIDKIPIKVNLGTSGDPRIIRFLPRSPLWPGDKPFRGAKIEAIASGPEQIQEYHPSHIFVDQIETIARVQDTMNAIMPIVIGSDKKSEANPLAKRVSLKIVGTPSPGWFERLVHDRLDEAV